MVFLRLPSAVPKEIASGRFLPPASRDSRYAASPSAGTLSASLEVPSAECSDSLLAINPSVGFEIGNSSGDPTVRGPSLNGDEGRPCPSRLAQPHWRKMRQVGIELAYSDV